MPRKPSNIAVHPYSTPNVYVTNSSTLTPRTPHSVHDDDEIDLLPEQQQPLLASSHGSSFHDSARGEKHDGRRALEQPLWSRLTQLVKRVPLTLGILLSIILLVLIVISYKKPELLVKVVSDTGGEDELIPPDPESITEPDSADEETVNMVNDSSSEPIQTSAHYIDYSNYTSFPLPPLDYAAECWKMHQGPTHHPAYWKAPPEGVMDVQHSPPSENQCTSTITYQLDPYVGLMAHLGLIAQIAAMARERNRTFFIDDQYWNRGKWTDHFEDVRKTQPGPEPGCHPAPPQELVACPRLAQHWVINSHSAKFHFQHDFDDEYHDAYAQSVRRLHPLYDRAFETLSNTVLLSDANADLVDLARQELGELAYTGVHLRRGDRKAVSWRYHGGYVPAKDYSASMDALWNRIDSLSEAFNGVIWLASDSMAAASELTDSLSENVDVFSLANSKHSALRALQPAKEYNQSVYNEEPLDQRRSETRGMIVDFAMLSGAWADETAVYPDAVICTFSSNICTLSALFLGWQRAFEDKLWVEIDNAGSIEPIWRAFEVVF